MKGRAFSTACVICRAPCSGVGARPVSTSSTPDRCCLGMHHIEVAAREPHVAAIWACPFTAVQLPKRAVDSDEQHVETFQPPEALVQPRPFLEHHAADDCQS